MSRRTQRNVGVIGLGIIGRRAADCLRRRGFHVFVWNRTPRPYPNFVGSPAEIAELCDFIQIFVSNDDALLEMVQQMKPSLKAHHVVLAHSTVAPDTVRQAAEIVQRRGGRLLDAPFTGSKGAAEKGELVYYVAGDDAAYRRARPVLEASGKEIIEIGEIGQAMTIKVATNMITAATVQVAAEALALVDRAGIPLEKFETAMRSNGSNSGTLALKLPKMLSRDFETQFSVKHMLKDVEIATRLARSYGLRLGVTDVARDGLVEELDRGGAENDYAAVVRGYFPEPAVLKEEPVHEEVQLDLGEEEPRSEEQPREEEVETLEDRNDSEAREEEQATEPVESPIEPEAELANEVAEESHDDAEQSESDVDGRREIEDELRPEEEEIGNAVTAAEAESASPEMATVAPEEEKEPRGFFSRIFGRSADY